ncbi:hypothetical protein [Pseudalkalibacillus salsuginis]|uniref:hypothetical protein n=1 Tax=Pseudalkalibacillus salsuginis TaxID=2910972 RepID=UPI001F1E33A7|nr:hypothetical protein [Pseudalkalibacillus salsuginis]MCF6408929.1 hypothetical protein [Pseudalkalibacillus salsuginis]
MRYNLQKENLRRSIKLLNEQQIDLWIIFTSEGSDPCLPFVTGVKTVGPGAFLITKNHGKLAVCSTIDAQDIEECGLFDEVRTYKGDLDEVLKSMVEEVAPSTVAINYSECYPLADGLTVGRFRWLQEMLHEVYQNEYISSESIIKDLIIKA